MAAWRLKGDAHRALRQHDEANAAYDRIPSSSSHAPSTTRPLPSTSSDCHASNDYVSVSSIGSKRVSQPSRRVIENAEVPTPAEMRHAAKNAKPNASQAQLQLEFDQQQRQPPQCSNAGKTIGLTSTGGLGDFDMDEFNASRRVAEVEERKERATDADYVEEDVAGMSMTDGGDSDVEEADESLKRRRYSPPRAHTNKKQKNDPPTVRTHSAAVTPVNGPTRDKVNAAARRATASVAPTMTHVSSSTGSANYIRTQSIARRALPTSTDEASERRSVISSASSNTTFADAILNPTPKKARVPRPSEAEARKNLFPPPRPVSVFAQLFNQQQLSSQLSASHEQSNSTASSSYLVGVGQQRMVPSVNEYSNASAACAMYDATTDRFITNTASTTEPTTVPSVQQPVTPARRNAKATELKLTRGIQDALAAVLTRVQTIPENLKVQANHYDRTTFLRLKSIT